MENLIDLHTHSVLSLHAYSTITENIDEANKIGLKYMGTSEHQFDNQGVGAHVYAFNNLRTVPDIVGNVRVLKGIELNLLNSGKIDYGTIRDRDLDYGILSIHGYVYDDEGLEGNTRNILSAMDDKHVNILGHLERGFYALDYDKIVSKAKDRHILIEINDSSLVESKHNVTKVKEYMSQIIQTCKKYDVPIIINSDAHIRYNVGSYKLGLEVLKENNYPLDRVLNFNEDLIKEYFKV